LALDDTAPLIYFGDRGLDVDHQGPELLDR
jgi:hypothetical protein